MNEYKLVPVELIDRIPEINPSNYGHDDVCALNAWAVEVVLASVAAPAVQGEPVGYIRRSAIELMEGDELGVRANIVKEPRYPDCVALYTAPQPAEQQPAPDVAGLVEALSESLKGIEIPSVLTPARAEFFKAGVHAAVNRLNTVLAAHRKQGGEV